MKTLVENCFALSTKLLRKDLLKARNKESVEGEYLNFVLNNRPSILDYRIEYEDGKSYLEVSVSPEPQRILLSEQELTFGTRTYLTCGCGLRTNALYLKGTYFACFKCQNLRYRSTTINTTSDHGKMLYQQNQRLKLIDMRESIPRPLYRSKYTKKFVRFLKLCNRAGLFGPVRDAQTTMETIREYQSQQV